MRISRSLFWHACWAAFFAGLFVVATPDGLGVIGLIWLLGLVFAGLAEQRSPRPMGMTAIGLVHVAVATVVIATAMAAPVKTRDRLMTRRVTLPQTEMSLGALKALADEDIRQRIFPARVWVSCPPSESDRVIRWPGREMTLRDFVAAIEGQTRLRHQFGSCGNGSTILWGGNCCFGLFLGVSSRRSVGPGRL